MTGHSGDVVWRCGVRNVEPEPVFRELRGLREAGGKGIYLHRSVQAGKG